MWENCWEMGGPLAGEGLAEGKGAAGRESKAVCGLVFFYFIFIRSSLGIGFLAFSAFCHGNVVLGYKREVMKAW